MVWRNTGPLSDRHLTYSNWAVQTSEEGGVTVKLEEGGVPEMDAKPLKAPRGYRASNQFSKGPYSRL